MKKLLLACMVAGLAACSTTPHISSAGGDGTSPARAVLLVGRLDGESIPAMEAEWIGKHYPGARMTVKVVSKSGMRKFEHVRTVLADGVNRDVFFDITDADGRYPMEGQGQVIQGKP